LPFKIYTPGLLTSGDFFASGKRERGNAVQIPIQLDFSMVFSPLGSPDGKYVVILKPRMESNYWKILL